MTHRQYRQGGAALFMALTFLLIMTLLGVSGMSNTRLENLMAGNSRFQAAALNNAEITLSHGIQDVLQMAGNGRTGAGNTGSIDPPGEVRDFPQKTITLPDGNSGEYVILDAGTDSKNGEDSSYSGTTTPAPGTRVQIFLVTARSATARGAQRRVQAMVVTEPLAH